MSLKEARKTAKKLAKLNPGKRVRIRMDRAACDKANPLRHKMSGNYVVDIENSVLGFETLA